MYITFICYILTFTSLMYIMYVYKLYYIYKGGEIMQETIKPKTPEYTKRANRNYMSKYDVMSIRAPKGTKEQIKEVYSGSLNDFFLQAVSNEIERLKATDKT